MASSNSIMVSEKSKRQSAVTNMKLSAALMGNNNAAGPHKMTVMGRNALKSIKAEADQLRVSMSNSLSAGIKTASKFAHDANQRAIGVRDNAVANVQVAMKSAKKEGQALVDKAGRHLTTAKAAASSELKEMQVALGAFRVKSSAKAYGARVIDKIRRVDGMSVAARKDLATMNSLEGKRFAQRNTSKAMETEAFNRENTAGMKAMRSVGKVLDSIVTVNNAVAKQRERLIDYAVSQTPASKALAAKDAAANKTAADTAKAKHIKNLKAEIAAAYPKK